MHYPEDLRVIWPEQDYLYWHYQCEALGQHPQAGVGVGGIMTAREAVEFLSVGARAVQVGTANFIRPAVTMEIIDGIAAYRARHGCGAVTEIIGSLKTPGAEPAGGGERT